MRHAKHLASWSECNYKVVATNELVLAWSGFGDDEKNRANKRDHAGLSFETAKLVFDDPLAASRRDPHPDGDRWQSVGVVSPVVLFVVHTWPEDENEAKDRIISARKATKHERKAYAEGDF